MADVRILVVRLSAMGDVIQALPAVASLKHSFPRSSLSWVIRPKWAPLLEGNPFVDRVIEMERSAAGTMRVLRELRKDRFDVVVDFQGLIQSALVAASVPADRKVGLHRSQVRERAASLFYSTAVLTRGAHRVERNLELAAAAGATNSLNLSPLPEGKPEGNLPDGKFVLASPLAGWTSKQWPLEYFSELARGLDMPLVVNGPPDAAGLLAGVEGAQLHLSGLPGLIDATRRAHAVIGVDSGPMHLAAALSKPGVAIYGPTDPAMTGPYGGSIRTLRDPGAITSYKRRAEIDPSMLAIQPDAVLEALDAVLRAKAASCPA
ncbi:MAG TPA: glycosyltransferase family 9 protein [Bryobacteraceae bacterium]|jgi:heptosyltransferase-1